MREESDISKRNGAPKAVNLGETKSGYMGGSKGNDTGQMRDKTLAVQHGHDNEARPVDPLVRRSAKARQIDDINARSKGCGPRGPQERPANRSGLLQIGPESPGYRLMHLLFNRAAGTGLSLADMAEKSGVSVSTLSHLRTGRRRVDRLEREGIEKIASWLELPVLSVMILAEQVRPEDFYGAHSTLKTNIHMGLRYISEDPDWGGIVPKDVDGWDQDAQLYILWCYEQATGRRLLPGGIDYEDLLRQMEDFRGEHALVEPDEGAD